MIPFFTFTSGSIVAPPVVVIVSNPGVSPTRGKRKRIAVRVNGKTFFVWTPEEAEELIKRYADSMQVEVQLPKKTISERFIDPQMERQKQIQRQLEIDEENLILLEALGYTIH